MRAPGLRPQASCSSSLGPDTSCVGLNVDVKKPRLESGYICPGFAQRAACGEPVSESTGNWRAGCDKSVFETGLGWAGDRSGD